MHWLRHKQPAQDLVQFGLMTAAVAIVALAGLEFLSGTIRWYFGDVAPTLAPPAASVPGFPLHKLSLTFTCADAQLVVGASTQCKAVLTDPDSLNPVPIVGNLTVASSGGTFTGCSLSPVSPNSVQCLGNWSSSQAGQFDLTASFAPKSNHVAADTLTSPAHITVFGVPTLKVTCAPTSVAVDSPSVCSASLQASGPSPSGLASRALNWSVTPAGSGTLTCSATSTCPPATPSCTTDSNGQCDFVFRPGPSLGQDTIAVTFPADDPKAFNPPFNTASTSTAITVVAPQLHDVDADVDWCQPTTDRSVLHCQVTLTDLAPAPNPPNPDTDPRSPPVGGTVTILTLKSSIQNSTCDHLTAFPPDHSTCYFDLVRNGDDHDQVGVTYGGDVAHTANTQFEPLDVHFDGGAH
jgi:hypothetical protein